jgi:hypothetical protein
MISLKHMAEKIKVETKEGAFAEFVIHLPLKENN